MRLTLLLYQIPRVSPQTLLRGGIALLSSSLPLMFLIYVLLTLLGYFWRGLRRFIRLLLIPGMIVHMAAHFLAAKVCGDTRSLLGLGIRGNREWAYGIIRTTKTREALMVAILPVSIALPLALLFQQLFYFTQGLPSVFFGWIAISLFLEGLPSTHDLQLVFLRHIANKPHAYLLLSWTVIVGALAYLVYPHYAVWIALGYFLAASTILLWPLPEKKTQKPKKVII